MLLVVYKQYIKDIQKQTKTGLDSEERHILDSLDLHALMQACPLHRWLGITLVAAEEGLVEVLLPFRNEFLGSETGTNIHGGIIATLADITACFAVMSATGRDTPNIDLHVDYLRMVGPGDLTAVGRTAKVGRTLGVADVEIHSGDGRLVAVARSKVVTNAPGRDALTKPAGDA